VGFRKVPLPGLPWSPEFMTAYEQALAGQPGPIGAKRTIPGTMRALAVSYFQSPEFASLRTSSQKSYRSVIEAFCQEHGDKRVVTLGREHVVKLMAASQVRRKEAPRCKLGTHCAASSDAACDRDRDAG
jgi:hypothetical protein